MICINFENLSEEISTRDLVKTWYLTSDEQDFDILFSIEDETLKDVGSYNECIFQFYEGRSSLVPPNKEMRLYGKNEKKNVFLKTGQDWTIVARMKSNLKNPGTSSSMKVIGKISLPVENQQDVESFPTSGTSMVGTSNPFALYCNVVSKFSIDLITNYKDQFLS